MTLEELIQKVGYNLRSISFHTDGRIIAKTGGSALHPKKLYTGKTAAEAVLKLIQDNMITIDGKEQTYDEVCDICGKKLYQGTYLTGYILDKAHIGPNGKYHLDCKESV